MTKLTIEQAIAICDEWESKELQVPDELNDKLYEDVYNNPDVPYEDKCKVLSHQRPGRVILEDLYYQDIEIGTPEFMIHPWQIPDPFGHQVVIVPNPIDTKIGSFEMPDEAQLMEFIHNTEGRIVAISRLAYKDRDDGADWVGNYPQLGNRTVYQKVGHTQEFINGVCLMFVPDEHSARGRLAPGTTTSKYYAAGPQQVSSIKPATTAEMENIAKMGKVV